MASEERPVIANLDFETVKQDLINNFKNRSEFADYEFTGSSLNLLMDILSYNTHYYSLASNFLLNESFLDTSLLRKNIVSLAKSLNYVPRTISAPSSTLDITVTKTGSEDFEIIPAGTLFQAASGNNTLPFYTIDDYTIQFQDGSTSTAKIDIYQGTYGTQRFRAEEDYSTFSYFDLSQDNIDSRTLTVSVNGVIYDKIEPSDETIFDLGSESRVYFFEENRNGSLNIVFGDGVVGRAIQTGDDILVSYLTTQGETGNGISSFSSNNVNIVIDSASLSQGGGDRESLQSIKDNAPKWFQSQYRAVTTNDYEVIIRNKFADIQAISVYGGEEAGQPGKVFICIKPKSADKLTQATKEIIRAEILKKSNIITVRPTFVDPRIMRLSLNTTVVYNSSNLNTNTNVLATKVSSLYDTINTTYIGEFLESFRESNLSFEIRKLDRSIVSSNTTVKMNLDVVSTNQILDNYTIDFKNRIYHPVDGFLKSKGGVIQSSLFKRVGRSFFSGYDDDGFGKLRLYDLIDNTKVYISNNAGTIDYTSGLIEIAQEVDPIDGTITFTAIPESVDIIASQDLILEIDRAASNVTVVDVDEIELLKKLNLNRSF